MKATIAKIIRTLTVPPVMAALLLSAIYVFRPDFYGSVLNFIVSLATIALFPLLAYPLQRFISPFKHEGREGQRRLAILLSNLGYILGLISVFFSNHTQERLILHLTYFLSGVLIFVFNRFVKIRASGHACGATGPVAALIWLFGLPALGMLIFLAAVYWASLTAKRHTLPELLCGSALPVISLFLSVFLVGAFSA